MKRISKAQQRDIDEKMTACETAASNLNAAIDAYNAALEAQRSLIEDAVTEYNDKVVELRAVYEDLNTAASTYMDERTDRWRESDKGQAYQEWIDALSDPEVQEIEIELPEPLEAPDEIPDFSDQSWLPASEPQE